MGDLLRRGYDLLRATLIALMLIASLGGLGHAFPILKSAIEWAIVVIYALFGLWGLRWQWRAHAAIRAERKP